MVEGLLFFKPALFIPRQKLCSIGAGRGGSGGAGTRYVDMMITMDSEKKGDEPRPLEFTNISREELGPLNTYINDILKPAMAREVAESEGGDAKPSGVVNVDEPDTVDAEVVDVEVIGEEDMEKPREGKRPRSGRGAAKAATDATRAQLAGGNFDDDEDEDDDSEEEGDYVGSEEEEEGSDEEGSGEDEEGSREDEEGSEDDDDEEVFADYNETDLMSEIEATIKDANEGEGEEGANKRQKL